MSKFYFLIDVNLTVNKLQVTKGYLFSFYYLLGRQGGIGILEVSIPSFIQLDHWLKIHKR